MGRPNRKPGVWRRAFRAVVRFGAAVLFYANSLSGGLRDKFQDLPPLWGVNLALILISIVGLTAIALHFEAILMVIAFCIYRLFDAAIGIIFPLLGLLLLFRILLRRR